MSRLSGLRLQALGIAASGLIVLLGILITRTKTLRHTYYSMTMSTHVCMCLHYIYIYMCIFMHVHVCTCVYIIFMHIHIRIHLRIQTHILIHSLNPEPELISDFPGPYIRFGGHGIGLRTHKYGVVCGTCCRAASESKAKQ